MNSKNTWIWLAMAAGLFAFIFLFERHIKLNETGTPRVFPNLNVADIRSIHVQPKGQRAIHVIRTNGAWQITEPLSYPAQDDRIDGLLEMLRQLTTMPFLDADVLKNIPDADTQFGFDAPQFSLMLNEKQHLVLIGKRTAPGDQVYLQVVGTEGIHVVDAALLNWVPSSANAWRETSLADWSQIRFNRVVVANAGKLLDLRLNATNHLWRMVTPNDVRADSSRIQDLLNQLRDLRAQEFVSDNAGPDLESFGLQTPDMTIELFDGAQSSLRLDFGRSPTNNQELVYARRVGQDAIVTVPKAPVNPWSSGDSHDFRDFLDLHLIAPSAMPDRIEVHADETFALTRGTNDSWRVEPAGYHVDSNLLAQLWFSLTNLQVTSSQIEKDIVPAADLPKYGLAAPFRKYVLQAAPTPQEGVVRSNLVVAQLEFGTNQNKLFARVAGETFVYSMDPSVLDLLPIAGWQMRDRRIWKFSETEVAAITIQQGGRIRDLLRKGDRNWVLAPGSQGIIDEIISAQIEESVHQLGDLSAAYWVQRGDANLEAFGLKPPGLKLTVELKNGELRTVSFGQNAPSQFPFAATELDGETWVFEFPWTIYQFVQLYLTIPPNVP